MSEIQETDIVQQQKRRKRVQTLKKLIIIGLFVAILIPIVLCVILFMKLNRLESQLMELQAKREADKIISQTVVTGETLSPNEESDKQEKVLEPKQKEAETALNNSQTDRETNTKKINVYLTFDDGPSSNTGAILDILKQYDVKATFFVVGKEEEKYAALYERIVDEGHTIGMHSYSHRYDEIYADLEGFSTDLLKLQDFIYDRTGTVSKVSRFPGGSSNTVSKVNMQELIQFLDENEITYYDWNVSSLDAGSTKLSVAEIVENVTGDIQTYNNAVVLMHDAADKTSTVEALPIIIERFKDMGNIEILPITEDTVKVQHIQK